MSGSATVEFNSHTSYYDFVEPDYYSVDDFLPSQQLSFSEEQIALEGRATSFAYAFIDRETEELSEILPEIGTVSVKYLIVDEENGTRQSVSLSLADSCQQPLSEQFYDASRETRFFLDKAEKDLGQLRCFEQPLSLRGASSSFVSQKFVIEFKYCN